VVLFEDTWVLHILNLRSGHGELEPHLAAVLDCIASPDHREADAWPHRVRFFKQDVGPSRWLMVVLDFEQEPAPNCDRARIRTRTISKRMAAMNVKIDNLIFDRANHDADGDVLYLARGKTNSASDAALTPEGHGVRYDADGEVIGATIINARRIIEHDGHLTIILPHAVRVEAGDLAAALG
jgi:uncharacterized protein YuzE